LAATYPPKPDLTLFETSEAMISAFIVPSAIRKPKFAATKIQYGEKLNPHYYPSGQKWVKETSEQHVFNMFMQDLYDKEDPVLSNIMNEKMYKPKDCMSGIFYAVIVKGKLNLNAYITGVNRNRSHLFIVNTFYDRKLSHLVLEEQKEILLATMAVWKTNKATMYVEKSGEKITINFDKKKMGRHFAKIG